MTTYNMIFRGFWLLMHLNVRDENISFQVKDLTVMVRNNLSELTDSEKVNMLILLGKQARNRQNMPAIRNNHTQNKFVVEYGT